MKKSLTLCGAIALSGLLLGTQPTFGQQGQGKPDKKGGEPAQRLERMKTNLGLSDEQTVSVKKVMAETKAEMVKLKADTSLTPEQRKEKGMETRKGTKAKMDAILTPEQQQKMAAMRPGKDKPKKDKSEE
jgi:Spy/CpxP family protein refolding chaperone